MVPTCSLDSIRDDLKRTFREDAKSSQPTNPPEFGVMYDMLSHTMAESTLRKYAKVRMLGLLFVRPETEFALDEILPNLDYYHHRSGKNIDFFCAGYGAWMDRMDGAKEVYLRNGEPAWRQNDITCWQFNVRRFDEFRREIEDETHNRWRYSGDSDLVLTNARYDNERDDVAIDFASSICIDLVAAKQDNAFTSVSALFEKVFQFAEGETGSDPTWGFSDRMGASISRNVLREAIFAVFPAAIREKARHSLHFYVRDLSGD